MKIHPKVKWLVRSEVSENVILQMLVGGSVMGFGIGLFTIDMVGLLEKIAIFEGLLRLQGAEIFMKVLEYLLPLVLTLYGARMLLHGVLQTLDDED